MAANSKIILDYMLNRLNCETKCNTRREVLRLAATPNINFTYVWIFGKSVHVHLGSRKKEFRRESETSPIFSSEQPGMSRKVHLVEYRTSPSSTIFLSLRALIDPNSNLQRTMIEIDLSIFHPRFSMREIIATLSDKRSKK